MPNIKLVIEYNGSRFHGWQKQPRLRTVQEELHKTLEVVLREEIREVIASGRTDAGVHARGQVVNFQLKSPPDLQRLSRAVSSIMRGELTVLDAAVVADEFHARMNATSKSYLYTIYRRDSPPVLDRGFVWFVPSELDVQRMQREAKSIQGEHDFASFQGSGCTAESSLRELFSSEFSWEAPYLRYCVRGSGFLKQMVRSIVGTLVEIGRGERCESMLEVLAARDRRRAGVTAPAYGLCLERVEY